jgi:thioredoxin reductase (NADPH)
MTIHKLIIIGSGPAGYTAAIYAARGLLNPLLITGNEKGGQLMTTTDIENFPGYINGVSGPTMMDELHLQAERFGTVFIEDVVESIENNQSPFKVKTVNSEFLCESIIVATGASSMWLNLENEDKLRSNGVSTCATCDGAFYKDENVIVVGGGDTAMEEAIFLTRYAKKVIIVHRRDTFKASKIMVERAQQNEKISWKPNSIVHEWVIDNNNSLSGAILKDVKDPNKKETIECTGAFIAIGHTPNTGFLPEKIETNSKGYIITKENTMTSIKGIFCCGDVCNSSQRYKQAITASGEGCKAAMDCEKWLSEQ